jgi:nicotinamide-nucleotide amidase
MMRAALLTIGDEILIGQILNSNAQWMSEQLTDLGVQVTQHLTVGDHEAEIVQAIDYCLPKSDFMIIGGGLGPTHDDVTMAALSHYFDSPLQYDSEWVSKIEAFFASRNRPMTENNKKQGFLLRDAIRIDNDCGTAAGQHFNIDETDIFVVPGVPHEMKSMMKRYILPLIAEKNPVEQILKRTLLVTGLGESLLATRLDEFVKKIQTRPDLTLAFLPSNTQVKVRLQMKSSAPEAKVEFEKLIDELKLGCGKEFFGFDPTTLEEVTVHALRDHGKTVALAESCTGGLVAHRLTQVSGSSEVLKGSIVAYQNEIKTQELGISEAFLTTHGAVSKETAIAMAEAIRKKWNSSFGLSSTGYLGPSGGDAASPVGTVWVALASERGTEAQEFHFENHRERAKERAAQYAIDLLRRAT